MPKSTFNFSVCYVSCFPNKSQQHFNLAAMLCTFNSPADSCHYLHNCLTLQQLSIHHLKSSKSKMPIFGVCPKLPLPTKLFHVNASECSGTVPSIPICRYTTEAVGWWRDSGAPGTVYSWWVMTCLGQTMPTLGIWDWDHPWVPQLGMYNNWHFLEVMLHCGRGSKHKDMKNTHSRRKAKLKDPEGRVPKFSTRAPIPWPISEAQCTA